MNQTRPRSRLRHSLHWLLWLALLVPLAQSVATAHGYSHSGLASAAAATAKQSNHLAACELCLVAAAVSGGATAPTQAPLTLPAARHAAPLQAAPDVWLALRRPAYASRAPPLAA